MPAADAEPTTVPKGSIALDFNLTRARILVVDDQDANVRLLQRILERAGFDDVDVTTSAETALRLAGERRYDLALLDLHMPEMDGVDLLARLKPIVADEPYLPIVFLSGDNSEVALALGVDPETAELMGAAAELHDIGKVGVPDDILRKPSRLTDSEMELMRRHANIGAGALAGSRSPLLQLGEQIARWHHERWDGSGYPDGPKSEAADASCAASQQ